MPRAAKSEKVDCPEELEKLREWLDETYAVDLPEAEKWQSHKRVRVGDTKTAGSRDVFFMTNEKPPKQLGSRIAVARHLGLEPEKAPAPSKRRGRGAEAEEEDYDEEEAEGEAPTTEELLEAALARRTPSASSAKSKGAKGESKGKKGGAGGATAPPVAGGSAAVPARQKGLLQSPKLDELVEQDPQPVAPKAVAAPAVPLFKRPTMLARPRPIAPAAAAAETTQPRAQHCCSLTCPLQCAGWAGLAALAGASRGRAVAAGVP